MPRRPKELVQLWLAGAVRGAVNCDSGARYPPVRRDEEAAPGLPPRTRRISPPAHVAFNGCSPFDVMRYDEWFATTPLLGCDDGRVCGLVAIELANSGASRRSRRRGDSVHRRMRAGFHSPPTRTSRSATVLCSHSARARPLKDMGIVQYQTPPTAAHHRDLITEARASS